MDQTAEKEEEEVVTRTTTVDKRLERTRGGGVDAQPAGEWERGGGGDGEEDDSGQEAGEDKMPPALPHLLEG